MEKIVELPGGIELWNAVDDIIRHKTKKYRTRKMSELHYCFHHHSGALGRTGLEGAEASAKFVVKQRGWPGMPYHFWLPYEDEEQRIYQVQRLEIRSYHTGGDANRTGLAVCWQGNLKKRRPSEFQYRAAESLMWWLDERHAFETVVGHSDSKRLGGSGKKSCPGPHVEEWLKAWRLRRRTFSRPQALR